MTTRNFRRFAVMFLLAEYCLFPAQAVDDSAAPVATPAAAEEATPESSGRRPDTSEAATEAEAATWQIKASLDFYAGVSDLPGQRRFRDGFWAGYGLGNPSVANLSWESGTGSSALISIGLGDYKSQFITDRQPVEAW